MKLNEIKGYIEIQGKKYTAFSLLTSLYKQKINVGLSDGHLKLGKIVLKPVSNERDINGYCKLSSICKLRDQIYENEGVPVSEMDVDNMFSIRNELRENLKDDYHESEIDFDMGEFDMYDLSDHSNMDSDLDNFLDLSNDQQYNKESQPKKMVGVNPLTRTGPEVNRVPIESIPDHLKTKCPYCGTTVSKTWKYCPKDGYIIK